MRESESERMLKRRFGARESKSQRMNEGDSALSEGEKKKEGKRMKVREREKEKKHENRKAKKATTTSTSNLYFQINNTNLQMLNRFGIVY